MSNTCSFTWSGFSVANSIVIVIAGLALALFGVPLFNLLDPMTLFHSFWDAFRLQPAGVIVVKILGLIIIITTTFIVPHIWCRCMCPLGGMQDIQTSARKFFLHKEKRNGALYKDRRLILGILAGFGVKLVLPKFSHPSQALIRPPVNAIWQVKNNFENI